MRGNTRARAPQDVRIRTGRGTIAGYALRVATAAALVIDAVVHLKDANFYDANAGALLTQGQLFRIQAVVAIVAALAVLAWPRWPSWLFAALVSASAAAAVVAYTYLDIGPIAGLPNMYEPSWGPPGKLVSAYAEGAGALLALAGLAYALARQRRAKAHARRARHPANGSNRPRTNKPPRSGCWPLTGSRPAHGFLCRTMPPRPSGPPGPPGGHHPERA